MRQSTETYKIQPLSEQPQKMELQYNNAETLERVRELIGELEAAMNPPWHTDTDSRITTGLYAKVQGEERDQLEAMRFNKLRGSWFTTLCANLEYLLREINGGQTAQFQQETTQLKQKTAWLKNTPIELVERGENLAKRVIAEIKKLLPPETTKTNINSTNDTKNLAQL